MSQRRRFVVLTEINCLVAAACILTCRLLPAAEIERVAVFRDGTLVKVTLADESLPWRRMTEDGRVFEEPVKLSEIERLKLVRTPATDQVANVRKLAAQLGDADFHKREQSQAELAKIGGKFRNILSEYVGRTTDMEVKWRLNVLLKSLPAGQGLIDFDYDLLTTAAMQKPVPGDAGPFVLTAKYRGLELTLDRAKVAALGDVPLLSTAAVEPPAPRSRRIEANDDRLFPPQVTRVDFERGPRGEELSDERDIAHLFAPLGCTFAVSLPGSFVSVQSYNVGGRSGGKCAATFSPRYQGTMTIRFCLPEYERIPAGVQYVGLSVSHVAPGGTALAAYDTHNRLLGEVKTTRTGTDFLALKCNTPIAYVKVVPIPDVDKDFAIDDLVFDPPQPVAESGEAERYSVLLASGERLFCAAVDTKDDAVILKQLSFGAEELKLPAAEVAAIASPQKTPPAGEPAKDCFVRMVDGSLLRASAAGGLKSLRFPKLAVNAESIVALWGSQVAPDMPDDDAWPEGAAVLVQRDQSAKPLTKWKLGPKWIESSDLSDLFDFSYADSPPLWLRKAKGRSAESGLLRLNSGEELVLDPAAFVLKRWSAAGVVVARGNEETSIPLSEVASLVFPGKRRGTAKP